MTCLITWKVEVEGDVVLQDTTPVDVEEIPGFDRDVTIMGVRHTISVQFDPPVKVP